MKKKIFVFIVSAIMLVSYMATFIFSMTYSAGKNFTDINNDGICDNYAVHKSDQSNNRPYCRKCSDAIFCDSENNGICDRREDCLDYNKSGEKSRKGHAFIYRTQE